MDEQRKVPMVTITLGEYNELRDKANDIIRLYDRINFMENRIREIEMQLRENIK